VLSFFALHLRHFTGHKISILNSTAGSREGMLTAVQVSLFGNLVVRIAIGVNGAIHLFERHKSMDELIVCVEKSAEPLFVLNMVNLSRKCQL
jgi:hypothetical protein